jgi:WD40 repeat protein
MPIAEPVISAECPVCGEPAGAQERCVRCSWTLRTGFVLGHPSPEEQVNFDERLRSACHNHDLRCAVLAADGDEQLLVRLLRFVRGGPPSTGELADAKSLPTNDFSPRQPPEAGVCAEVGADGITLIRFGEDAGHVYEFAEVEHSPWRELLSSLPDDVEEQRFLLAGGRPVDTSPLTGDRFAPLRAVHCGAPGWLVPERVAATLRRPNTPLSYVDSLAVRVWHAPGRIAAFAATGDVAVTGGVDGTVRVLSTARESAGHDRRVTAVGLADGGDSVVSGGQDGVVRLWHTPSGRSRVLATHDGWVNAVGVAGAAAFSLGDDGKLRRSSLGAPDSGASLDVGWAASTALAAGGGVVAFGGTDSQVQVFDGQSWQHRHTIPASAAIRSIAVDPGGTMLVIACDDGSLSTYDLTEHEPVGRLVLPAVVTCVCVNANGTVVFGDDLGWVGLWRRNAKHVVFGRHQDGVVGVAMTRAGAVVSAERGGLVRGWPHRGEEAP